MVHTFRSFVVTLIRLMRWQVALVAILLLGMTLTQGVALLLLVPLLSLAGVPVHQGGVSSLAAPVSSAFAAVHLRPTLAAVLILYVVVAMAQALLQRAQEVNNTTLQMNFAGRLREELYDAITRANWLFLVRRRSSDLVHALTAEVDRTSQASQMLMILITNTATALVYLALALRLATAMTLILLAAGLLILVLLKGRIRRSQVVGEDVSRVTSDLYAATVEHVAALKTTKSYGAQERHVAIFGALARQLAGAYRETIRVYADATLVASVGSVVLLAATVYVAIDVLSVHTAALLLLLFLFSRIVPSLTQLQQGVQGLAALLPSFARLMRLEAECRAEAEPAGPTALSLPLRQEVRYDHVSFAYSPAPAAPVIRDLSLTIPAGETTAIVGPSGAGKSTVADLVLALIQPDTGTILVDGTPLTPDRAAAWRANLSYVAQETFLFHDTIRANLLWSFPDASSADIQEALRLAAADDFIAALPNGLDTIVGDRGVRLSGGERQRLALARALLRRPTLLVLDEATSAVDSENERRIRSAIEGLHGRITILMIAHRLSTVRHADCILVLEAGRLVESGSWDTLLRSEHGRFRAMCDAQATESVPSA